METTSESGGEDSTSDGHDQDSSMSLENDTESGSSQSSSDEEEDWIEYINRSTREAEAKHADMENDELDRATYEVDRAPSHENCCRRMDIQDTCSDTGYASSTQWSLR